MSTTDDLPSHRLFPTTPLALAALSLAHSSLSPSIFNHSIRVFIYAYNHCVLTAATLPDPSLLFTACLLHDVGTSSTLHQGPQRFEVEGADIAANLVRKFSAAGDPGGEYTEQDADEVWMAIALHTSPGIADRRGLLVQAVRKGVKADFPTDTHRYALQTAPDPAKLEDGENIAATTQELESDFPRLNIEIDLADAVIDQAVERPEKAPMATWPGVLLAARLDGAKRGELNPAF